MLIFINLLINNNSDKYKPFLLNLFSGRRRSLNNYEVDLVRSISDKGEQISFNEVETNLYNRKRMMPFCKGGCNLLKEIGEEECIPEKYILDEYIKLMYMEATTNV